MRSSARSSSIVIARVACIFLTTPRSSILQPGPNTRIILLNAATAFDHVPRHSSSSTRSHASPRRQVASPLLGSPPLWEYDLNVLLPAGVRWRGTPERCSDTGVRALRGHTRLLAEGPQLLFENVASIITPSSSSSSRPVGLLFVVVLTPSSSLTRWRGQH